MSFRGAGGPSTAMDDWMDEITDFKKAVEDGDYFQGVQEFGPSLKIGDLQIDVSFNDQGNMLVTLTNAISGNSVNLVQIP